MQGYGAAIAKGGGALAKMFAADILAEAVSGSTVIVCDKAGVPSAVTVALAIVLGATTGVIADKALLKNGIKIDDNVRYKKYWDDVANGKYDIPYGMTSEEYIQYLKGLDKVDKAIKGSDDVIKGGSETITYSGEEWCRYFRETYDADNVIWEKATPSQLARSWQGTGKYIGIDDYVDMTVQKGTVLYRGEPNGTEYFTTLDAIEQSGRDATNVFEGLQVEKNPIHGYRGEMQGYVFNEDIASAYGITNANPQFGKGGLPQYFVPDVDDYIQKGILEKVDSI